MISVVDKAMFSPDMLLNQVRKCVQSLFVSLHSAKRWTREFLPLHLEQFVSSDLSKRLTKLSGAYVLCMILNWNSHNLVFKVVSKGKANIRFH